MEIDAQDGSTVVQDVTPIIGSGGLPPIAGNDGHLTTVSLGVL